MKSHLLLAFKHVSWAAFGSWFKNNNNTLLQNFSEKNVLKKKKTPVGFFFQIWNKKKPKKTLKDDIYAKQQGCKINVTPPSFTEQLRWPDIFSSNIVMWFFPKYCNHET